MERCDVDQHTLNVMWTNTNRSFSNYREGFRFFHAKATCLNEHVVLFICL